MTQLPLHPQFHSLALHEVSMFMVGHGGRELVLKNTSKSCVYRCGSLFCFFLNDVVLSPVFVKLLCLDWHFGRKVCHVWLYAYPFLAHVHTLILISLHVH